MDVMLHETVFEGRISRGFPRGDGSLMSTRAFCRDVLRYLQADAAMIERADQIVTALADNVVRHAGSGMIVDASSSGRAVRVEVEDWSTQLPRLRPGRGGLDLVDRLADRWGVRERPRGKTVWFELDLPA